MAKNSIRDYDSSSSNNSDVQSVDISEGCSPSGINNAIREVMADLADVNEGTIALESPKFDSIKDGNIKPPDASGTDVAGTATTIKGGAGTGTGAGGSIVFQTADGGSTGSSVNAHATAMTITDDGSIDINGNDLILDADADTKLYASTDDVVKMDIAGSEVFRFDADGLKFNGDTATANAISDYEEGTFTPTLFGSSGTNSITYVRQLGVYRKIGKICFYIIRFQWSAFSGGTGGIRIGGLPFTSRANSDSTFDVTTDIVSHGVDIPSNAVDIPAFYTAQNNTELVSIYTQNGTGWGTWPATSFYTTSANHYMSLSGSYFTD